MQKQLTPLTVDPPLFYREKAAFLKSLPQHITSKKTPTRHLSSYLQHYQLDHTLHTFCEHYIMSQSSIDTREGTYRIVQQYWQATQRHQESEIKNNPKDESKTDHTNKSTNGNTGTVVIAHGYLDHSGLYGRLIEWSLQQGYDVLCFDLPGHGLSSGEAASIEQFSTYADILEQLVAFTNSSLKKPYIAIGQSTGCAVIANYLLRKRPTFDRAILLAPLIRSAQWRWLRYLYKILVRTIPRIRRKFIASSHDETFNHFLHHQDPLQARYIPLAWLGAMDSWYLYCQQQTTNTNDKGENRTIAVDIIQGTQDATVDWRYNVGELHRLFANTTTHYIQGAKHHLVNEAPCYWQRIKDTLDRIVRSANRL